MAIATPAVVTIDGTAHNLNRINQDGFGSVFRKIATGVQYDLAIRHSTEKAKLGAPLMDRHNVDMKYTTFNVDGVPTVYQVYVVMRTPQGADPTIVEKLSAGFLAYVTSIDGPVIGWEN